MTTVEARCVVVGAGVVGLAIGAALARRGTSAFVVEAMPRAGTGISSRNSEVIHSGIYYPEGSLKHRLCIAGRRRLYDYCERRGVPHRRCGKLVVATDAAEVATIERIGAQGRRNGVENMELIDGAAARRLEPALRAEAAIHVSETGIVDSHGLMSCLIADIEDGGGAVLLNHRVVGGCVAGSGRFALDIVAGEERFRVTTPWLIIAAGLDSHAIAASIDGFPARGIPPLVLAKGSYFSYPGAAVFSRLIYPAPIDGGLGVHLTLDLMGRMRFGPDVEWLGSNDAGLVDYGVDRARAGLFFRSIRRYWPGVVEARLQPDYSGVRPKLGGPGTPMDFLIHGPRDHNMDGLVSLFGIESPGLTASLAIAGHVVDMLGE